MKFISLFTYLFLLYACDSGTTNTCFFTLRNNIVLLANQGSGVISLFDLESETKISEIDLHIKLQNWKNKGNPVDDFFINSPRPHYVMTSSNGQFIYAVLTAKNGAIVKINANLEVVNFLQITDTEYPAHAQLTSDNQTIFVSTWTTNEKTVVLT